MKLTNIIASAIILTASASTTFAQTADEIVLKHVQAIGGEEKWKAIKNVEMVMKTNTGGADVEIKTVIVVGKSTRTDIAVMGNEIITVIDGETGWMIRPAMMGGTGEVEDLPVSVVGESKKQMEVGDPLISLKEKGSTVELVGKEKLDGDEVYHLKATSKTGAISNYYISTANYYMLKSLSKTKVQNQEIDSEVTYSNFKQVDGLTFAYTKEQPSPQGGTMTVETESIKLNQTIDESIFKKPAKK